MKTLHIPPSAPAKIYVDMQITRRKTYHVVTDWLDKPLYRSRLLSDCIAYMDEAGVTEYTLIPEAQRQPELPFLQVAAEASPPWQNSPAL